MGIRIADWAPTVSEEGQKIVENALPFVRFLVDNHAGEIYDLLEARKYKENPFQFPDSYTGGSWKVGKIPHDLLNRTVEITGPPTRKMVINALNSGANCYMADFEDSCSPTWSNLVEGQVNLRDAVDGTISLHDPKKNKHYKLVDDPAVLMVRPRGLHLPEKHLAYDGMPIPGCLFDFGVYLYTNAQTLIDKGTGPYFYIPKLESAEEAELWNHVFDTAEDELGLHHGTIKCTVLIETLTAAFQMEDILWKLRNHIVGLNCGRWDYIFSGIKNRPYAVCPDRDQIGMDQHCMKAYADLLIQTCHRHGAFAMGGMAAQIPIKNNPGANELAMSKVTQDKSREALAGHDGTWIAHPGLLEIAQDGFAPFRVEHQNSLHVMRDDVHVSEEDLITTPKGTITIECVEKNARVCMEYMKAWLDGNGCVPINDLMEDAATAEISRTQLWQWVHNKSQTDRGAAIDLALVTGIIDGINVEDARPGTMLLAMLNSDKCEEFLTLRAYDELIAAGL
jgi:malate synthase